VILLRHKHLEQYLLNHMKMKLVRICRSLSILPLLLGALDGGRAAEPPKVSADSSKASVAQQADKTPAFADFEKGKAMTLDGGSWEVFTDASMGGKSALQISVLPSGAEESKGALKLSAKLTPDFQWGGFAGVRAWCKPDGSPKDMSAVSGVQFYARGDGKNYRVLIAKENVKEGNHFAAEFTAPTGWTLIRVPFSTLAQLPYGTSVQWSPTNVTGIGFLASAEPGKADERNLELDNIRFYSGK
jgi:hypothetical protein